MSKQKERLATSSSHKSQKRDSQAVLLTWNEIPPWQQDNQFIIGSYRPESKSYYRSVASLVYLHNESVNIWTHLAGAVAFAIAGWLVYMMLSSRYAQATNAEAFAFGCFFLSAVACLGMSATFHMISNHSENVCTFSNKLDHLGIVLLIWGSFVPSIFYGFACEPQLLRSYLAMITTIGAMCTVTALSSKFRTPAWRPFRAAMFVAMGLSAVFPVLHGILRVGYTRLVPLIGLHWLVLQGLLYIAGAVLYAVRIPERWSPGSFDIWGSSHQIFHILVLLAASAHLLGLIQAFDHHHLDLDCTIYR